MAAGRQKCCQCNGRNARCKSCVCCRAGQACTNCRLMDSLNGGRGWRCCNSPLPAAAVASSSPSARSSTSASDTSSPSPAPLSHTANSDAGTSDTAPSFDDSPQGVPSLSQVFELSIHTLNHVPKGARDIWAAILSTVIESVVAQPYDVSGWCQLLMLPKCILSNPVCASSRSRSWRETIRIVKERVRMDGADALSDDLVGASSQSLGAVSSSQRSNLRRAKRASF